MRFKNILAAGGLLAAVLVGALIAQALDPGVELAIAERVVKARDDYKAALTELVNYYQRSGDISSARRAERELDNLGTIEQYVYPMKTAGPVVEQPIKVQKYVVEADEYYTDGIIIAESRRKVRKDIALKRFEKVLENWPESEKAPLAAFEMAEIYAGIYFGDFDLAAEYYKKCYDLDPYTSLPALLNAGRMYEKLGRNDDAITIYGLAIKGSREPKQVEKAEKARDRLLAKKSVEDEE